jgi:hypothetical protein
VIVNEYNAHTNLVMDSDFYKVCNSSIMIVFHWCDIDIYNICICYRVIVIVQQYSLPEILPLLNKVDTVPRDL